MLKVLKSNSYISYSLLIFLILLLKFPFVLNEPKPIVIDSFFLKDYYISISNTHLSFILAQVVILIQAIWLTFLFNNSFYVRIRGIIPAYFFILVSSAIESYQFINEFHLIVFILLLLYQIFLNINLKENAKTSMFNVGLLFGGLIVLYPNCILFTPFLLFIVYVLKPLHAKEVVLTFLGILCILFLYFSYSYFLNLKIGNPFYFYFYVDKYPPLDTLYKQAGIIALILFLFISFTGMLGIKQSTDNKVKRNVDMLVILLIGLTVVCLMSSYYLLDCLTLLFIPLSIFFSIFTLRIKKQKFVESVHLILLLTILIQNFFMFLENYNKI